MDNESLIFDLMSVFDKIPILKGPGDYLQWSRSMCNRLEAYGLGDYLDDEFSPKHLTPDEAEQWSRGNRRTRAIIRERLGPNPTALVEGLESAKQIWDKLKAHASEYKAKNLRFLFDCYTALESYVLSDFSNAYDYTDRFLNIVDEIEAIRPGKSKVSLPQPLYIYFFHRNLGPEYSMYRETYNHCHDPFKKDGTSAYDITYAVKLFVDTIITPAFPSMNFAQQHSHIASAAARTTTPCRNAMIDLDGADGVVKVVVRAEMRRKCSKQQQSMSHRKNGGGCQNSNDDKSGHNNG
ncbi:MAG: hypothetical protein Q9195_009364 [Heterodermia aff. obscurata]